MIKEPNAKAVMATYSQVYLAVDYSFLLREHERTVKYFLDLFQTSRRLALGYKQVNANGH
jgi:hypothetical protein